MVNMSAKFDKEMHNGLVSSVSTSSFQYMSIVTLTFDLKINRVHPFNMANMSAEFDQEALNGLVAVVFIRLFPYICCDTYFFTNGGRSLLDILLVAEAFD